MNAVYASDEARQYAINTAYALQETLGSDYPSFVKPMAQSHVTRAFWLGLPAPFCREHLSMKDDVCREIVLVDEEGAEFPTRYLPLKKGLTHNWRQFVMDHGLVDGDCLVFELIEPTKFRVYMTTSSDKVPTTLKTDEGVRFRYALREGVLVNLIYLKELDTRDSKWRP